MPPAITKTELSFLRELKDEGTTKVMAIPIEEIIKGALNNKNWIAFAQIIFGFADHWDVPDYLFLCESAAGGNAGE